MYTLFPLTYRGKLNVKRTHNYFKAYLCVSTHPLPDLKKKRIQFLHPDELAYYNSLTFQRRQESFLLGRYCAKQVLSAYLRELDTRKILVHHGVFEQPIVHYPTNGNVQVSISHCDEWGGAVAFPEEYPMAIDLEKVDPDKGDAILAQCTSEESQLIKSLPGSNILQLTLIWTAKEALSKVLKCGFTSPINIFAVQNVEHASDCFIWTFKNFAQYKAVSCIIAGTACSIITPKRTEVLLDVKSIEQQIHCPVSA
ncbi:MAG: 4'-phosphopantetheinyl transferase superfamily protein [bacterium]